MNDSEDTQSRIIALEKKYCQWNLIPFPDIPRESLNLEHLLTKNK